MSSPLRSRTMMAASPSSVDLGAAGAQGGAEPRDVRAGDAHPAAGAGGELGQRGLGDRAPARDHDDLVGGLGDLGQHVAGDEHGAALGGERAQEVAQPADALRVEAVGGLVEHQHARVAEQGGGEPEPLAHAERVAAGAAVRRVREPDELEQLVRAGVGHARGPCDGPQVVAAAAAGMEHAAVEHRADRADRIVELTVRPALDRRGAARRPDEAQQRAQGRRLARSVRPQKPDDPAGLDA